MHDNQGANQGFLREKLVSDHGLFAPFEIQQGAANGQISRGVFSGMHSALDGWMLARAQVSRGQCLQHTNLGILHVSLIFMYDDVWFGLVDYIILKHDFSALSLRALAAGM